MTFKVKNLPPTTRIIKLNSIYIGYFVRIVGLPCLYVRTRNVVTFLWDVIIKTSITLNEKKTNSEKCTFTAKYTSFYAQT